MRLSTLIAGLATSRSGGGGDPDISALTADSRSVSHGSLFAALPGGRHDGAAFAQEAVSRGAAAILISEQGLSALTPQPVPVLVSRQPRLTLSQLAARLYPRQPATIVAITGTSGKTSVASFARQIFSTLGHRSASLGTLGVVVGEEERYGSLTTPDPVALHCQLDELAGDNVTHLALEASSHGLDQFRLDGVRLAAGAFTNLSHDHLDYHRTSEAYLAAKLRLVNEVMPVSATLVVDCSSAAGVAFEAAAERRGIRVLSLGAKGRDICVTSRDRLAQGQRLAITGRYGAAEILLPLVGDFQAANALVAAGLAIAAGEAPERAFAALATLKGVKGRIEHVGSVDGAAVYVDYAHKPDALDNVLDALRPYAAGRLVVVFGCGGDRDSAKRAVMGEIAARKADVVIVTDDNPRSEDPALIRAAILKTCPGALEIGPRGEAISHAVDCLRAGDILVIAGKGHETGQIVADRVLPFSDHEAVRAAISVRGGQV
ncbi:MAG: UDP-N-acetylmuramoyl-L-alanyl-D-glutamate--2,6-diaminopimelate ligase [Hyphomicrobiales bacterium]|nr:UDP-N-acetylmuramoyl-L-alanyl-D-glutamate--2,6-diaminopimelate ligase [Hyphomicrobiales bacterium]